MKVSSRFFLFFCAAALLPIFSSAFMGATQLPTPQDIARFKQAKLLNDDIVSLGVGFSNPRVNPYPPHPQTYNVNINYTQKCWVTFKDPEKQTYELTTAHTMPESEYGTHLTHTGPCGVCSSLQDLAVYLEKRDLTRPVRLCAMIPVPGAKRQCIRNVGFSDTCSWIWYWNSVHTAQPSWKGGCRKTCIRHLTSKYNIPSGNYNPCRPPERDMFNDYVETNEHMQLEPSAVSLNTELAVGRRNRNMLGLGKPFRPLFRSERKKKESKGLCRNTINHNDACERQQYENGQYRLNPCLQCDECQSGPMFKKVAGRTRRNSGIRSAIERPDGLPDIPHRYYDLDNDLSI